MKMLRLLPVVLMLLILIGAETAFAEKRVALVIGNAAYRNATPLKNPLNDATDIASKLRELKFEVVEGTDLDMDRMRDIVRSFLRKTDGADIAVFFYAGHGLQVDGTNYLAPVDASLQTPGDLQFETIPIKFVLGPMEFNAKTNIVFLDACRDNPLARNLARSMGTRSALVGRGLAEIGTGVGTLISFATQPGNVALDGEGRNSPFTTALLKHIGKPGASLAETMASVRRDVLKATNGNQVPWEHSSLTGNVVFGAAVGQEPKILPPAHNPPTVDDGTKPNPAVELALWQAIKESDDPELFEDFLRRFPTGVFSVVARKRLAALRRPADPPKKPDAPKKPAPPKSDGGLKVTLVPQGHCSFQKSWFSAEVVGTGKYVSICGSDSPDGNNAFLYYHFGRIGFQELIYPKSAKGSMNAFVYRRQSRRNAIYLKLEFTNGGYRYEIREGQVSGKSSAGLYVIRESDGKVVADFRLAMTTRPLSLMQLEDKVPTRPYMN